MKMQLKMPNLIVNIKIWCLKQWNYKKKTYWNTIIYFIEIYNFKKS